LSAAGDASPVAPNGDAARSLFGESAFATTRDGRRLHYASAGTALRGAPSVVFEAGMGSSRGVWGLVQPAVAARTRVVEIAAAASSAAVSVRSAAAD
jgi:hypothetical protein